MKFRNLFLLILITKIRSKSQFCITFDIIFSLVNKKYGYGNLAILIKNVKKMYWDPKPK